MTSRALVAAALAALAVAACGSGTDQSNSGSVKDNLVLTGPVKADSSSEKGGGCVWTPAAFGLSFTSGSMQGGAKVTFSVTVGVGAVGDESATEPARPNGQTPLTLVAGGKTINATEGTVKVTNGDVQTKTFSGTIEGTFEDGTKISGSWSCQAVLG